MLCKRVFILKDDAWKQNIVTEYVFRKQTLQEVANRASKSAKTIQRNLNLHMQITGEMIQVTKPMNVTIDVTYF